MEGERGIKPLSGETDRLLMLGLRLGLKDGDNNEDAEYKRLNQMDAKRHLVCVASSSRAFSTNDDDNDDDDQWG